MIRSLGRILCLLLAPVPSYAEVRESLQRAPDGYVYVLTERVSDAPPTHVLVLLAGGDGLIDLVVTPHKTVRASGYEDTRKAMAEAIGAAATVDLGEAIDIEARSQAPHLQKLLGVLNDLRSRYKNAPLYVYGISNGAISAAHLARHAEARLAGVVLASASSYAVNRELLGEIKSPVLIVHHKRDSCTEWRYISDAAKWHTTLLVDDVSLPRPMGARACGRGTAHQFGERRREVLDKIAEWMKTGKTVATL